MSVAGSSWPHESTNECCDEADMSSVPGVILREVVCFLTALLTWSGPSFIIVLSVLRGTAITFGTTVG